MTQNIKEKGMLAKLGLPQVKPPWGLTDVVGAFLVLLVCTLMIGTTITATIATSTTNPDPISLIMGWLIGLVIVFAFVIIRWRSNKEQFDALRLLQGKWQPLLAVFIGLGGAFTASLIVGLLSGDFLAPLHVLGIDNRDIGSLLLVGLFVLLVQPIAESLVFQGIALPYTRSALSAWGGILTTVALYAVYYYLVYGTRGTDSLAIWYGVIYPIVVGFTLTAVRVWSRSTLSTMLAHIGVGASVLITLLVI